jgi:hypothetical protein
MPKRSKSKKRVRRGQKKSKKTAPCEAVAWYTMEDYCSVRRRFSTYFLSHICRYVIVELPMSLYPAMDARAEKDGLVNHYLGFMLEFVMPVGDLRDIIYDYMIENLEGKRRDALMTTLICHTDFCHETLSLITGYVYGGYFKSSERHFDCYRDTRCKWLVAANLVNQIV